MRPQASASPRIRTAVIGALVLVATAALGTSLIGTAGAQSGASSTTVTATGSGTGNALLTGVTATNTGETTATVRFTFAGPAVPDAIARRIDGPVLQSPVGTPITVDGNALVQTVLRPASGFDLGSCAAPPAVVPGAGEVVVVAAFTCATAAPAPWPVLGAPRVVPTPVDDAALLQAALDELVGGTTPAEAGVGLSSPFSAATVGTVTSVVIQPSGRVDVDLAPGITAALPNPDGDEVVRGLDGTIGQYVGLTGARYTIGGDCTAFETWTGTASCDRTDADVFGAYVAQTYTGPERVAATGSGPLVEVVEQEDFEAQLGWVAGLRVPAGSDVVATVSIPAGGTTVDVTFTVVALPTPAPVSPAFTG